jgi:hypothetical protein
MADVEHGVLLLMGGKRVYNEEFHPPGTRIRVHAPQPMDGSDHDWHGYKGVVLEHKHWTLCRMDKKPRNWPSHDVLLCDFNLWRE